MQSENESGSEGQSDHGVTAVFGIYFCNKCKNVLSPIKANGHNLQFNCPICGVKFVDFSRRTNEDCMLYSKELQIGSKKYVPEEAYIFDPTMPKVDIECPECGYDKAVYFLTPDEGETKIVAKMICASATGTTVKCGNMWDLNDKDLLLRTRVLTEEEQYN